jgi:hypothetical protein
MFQEVDADLVRGETRPAVVVHGLDEVGDQGPHAVVDRGDLVARGAEHGVGDGADLSHRHARILPRRRRATASRAGGLPV